MRYKDPKTGEVFLSKRAFRIYCDEKRGGNIDCPTCPICSKNNGTGESCKSFFKSHPVEAAQMMGYEVIDDTPTDTPTTLGDTPTARGDTPTGELVKQKPRLAEVLGVEVGERFQVDGAAGEFWVESDGGVESSWTTLSIPPITRYILYAINHPESVIRAPRLTESEIAIMRAVGAKWVSRNINNGVDCAVNCAVVYLWKEKPSSSIGLYFADGGPIATVNDPDLFPSVKPGDLIEYEKEKTK